MQELHRFLEKKFQLADWSLTRPRQGHRKECYIAWAGNLNLFIKFKVTALEPLRRLGEIGVAPEVVAAGHLAGKPFVIQEYLEAENPTPAWFNDHLDYLAGFIRRYQDDEILARLVEPTTYTGHAGLVARDIAELERRFSRLQAAGKLDQAGIGAAFEKFKSTGAMLPPAKLVPVHAEPNTTNMLLPGERLVMVDWDEIRLGDPMQDVGLILWWYVRPEKWAEFFDSYGLKMDGNLQEPIFWWTARASLAIALWQFEHGVNGQAFLEDFQAAVKQEPNPHAAF